MRDIFFRPGAYYIELEKQGRAGVFLVIALHRSARAALRRINPQTEGDPNGWMGVADNLTPAVTKRRLLSARDPVLKALHPIPMTDFVSLVAEVEREAPELLEEPPLIQQVVAHTGAEIRHVMCADVLAYKAIVQGDPGITTTTRILPRPGLEEATFGQEGVEVESTSTARTGPAHLVFLAHQLAVGRFGQIGGPVQDVGFRADHLVVASDALYGVYMEPQQVLNAAIHAIRWCLQSVGLFSYHHAIRVGVGSGTSVRLCESSEDEVVADLRRRGHLVAMYYGTGYVNAYLAEQKLCRGRGPCIVVAPDFCEQIIDTIDGLLDSGRLVPHPCERNAFDVNYLVDLSDEEAATYRARLEHLGEMYQALASADSRDESRKRFAASLREFDHYDELRRKMRES